MSPSADPSGTPSKVNSRDRTPIATWTTGEGPSVVLVHGRGIDASRWDPLLPQIAEEFRVTTMDRRGHGLSGDAPAYALDREVDDVVAVLEDLPAPVDLLGHGFGAVLALEAALRTPRVRNLVLYEPPIRGALDPPFPEPVLAQIRAHMNAGQPEDALRIFLQRVEGLEGWEVEALSTTPSWPHRVNAAPTLARETEAVDAYDVQPPRLAAYRKPVHLLVGSETRGHRRSAVDQLHDALPKARTTVLRGAGHIAMGTDPEGFAEHLQEILKGD